VNFWTVKQPRFPAPVAQFKNLSEMKYHIGVPHVLPEFISRALIINLSYKTTLNTGESEVIEM
jgi:hypothetical protein